MILGREMWDDLRFQYIEKEDYQDTQKMLIRAFGTVGRYRMHKEFRDGMEFQKAIQKAMTDDWYLFTGSGWFIAGTILSYIGRENL